MLSGEEVAPRITPGFLVSGATKWFVSSYSDQSWKYKKFSVNAISYRDELD
jgi:hypothetical protein